MYLFVTFCLKKFGSSLMLHYTQKIITVTSTQCGLQLIKETLVSDQYSVSAHTQSPGISIGIRISISIGFSTVKVGSGI